MENTTTLATLLLMVNAAMEVVKIAMTRIGLKIEDEKVKKELNYLIAFLISIVLVFGMPGSVDIFKGTPLAGANEVFLHIALALSLTFGSKITYRFAKYLGISTLDLEPIIVSEDKSETSSD